MSGWEAKDFGDLDEPFEVTLDMLKGRVCSADELWVNPEDPYADHGHTDCLFLGWAITEIERLRGDLARFVPMFSASKNNLYAGPPHSTDQEEK